VLPPQENPLSHPQSNPMMLCVAHPELRSRSYTFTSFHGGFHEGPM
jgi:hypothetical protein